jgi:predicted lipase
MTKSEAVQFTESIKSMVSGNGRSWMKVALACRQCRNERIWELAGSTGFGAWLGETTGKSRSYVYSGIDAIDKLEGSIEETKISDLTLDNARLLSKVPTSRREELFEAARNSTAEKLLEAIEREVPGLHIETHRTWSVRLTDSQRDVVNRALEEVGKQEGIEGKGNQLEAICAEWEAE